MQEYVDKVRRFGGEGELWPCLLLLIHPREMANQLLTLAIITDTYLPISLNEYI